MASIRKEIRLSRPVRLLAAACLCLFGAFAGCPAPATGYQTYTLEEGVGHLSFEHPARYGIKTVQLTEDESYTMVDAYGPVNREDRSRPRLWVTVTRANPGPPDAGAFLQSALDVAVSLPDFRFVERSPVTVDGATGEQVVYANTMFRSDYETRVLRLKPVTVLNRQVFVAHGESVWSISITVKESIAAAEMAEFERLLASFKFLN